MNRVIIILSATLVFLASCVKVEEIPLTVETGDVSFELLSINDLNWCEQGQGGLPGTLYEFKIPIINLEDILIKDVYFKTGDDEPVKLNSIEFESSTISALWCYWFFDNDHYDTIITISATNKAGEQIANKDLMVRINRPAGAN